MKRYVTRESVAGNVIEWFNTIEEAKKAIHKYEEEDKRDGYFEPDFYEIYDNVKEEIIEL